MVYMIVASEEDEKKYWSVAAKMVGITEESARAFCPGTSPPDNSCSPANKGTGDGGRKGGQDRPRRVPTRPPSKAEVAKAAQEGSTPKHVQARKAVAAHFLQSQGTYRHYNPDGTFELRPLDRARFKGQMAGIDWSKPVRVGPPPRVPPPREFVQWQAPGNVPPAGGYFSTPDAKPEMLGIGKRSTVWNRDGTRGPTVERVPHAFEVEDAPNYIASTAAPTNDRWSVPGVVQPATGGGPQWFIPEAQADGGVPTIKFKGRKK